MTYENQGAKASQLLSDRVAPTFDPTIPQKVDPKTLHTLRMNTDLSGSIRKAVGATAFEELDHIMPLELGGSNLKTNLRLEPADNTNKKYSGGNPTPTDPLENSLAAQVHSGQISLVDGWKAMAKAKGITLPEDGGSVPNLGQPGIQPNIEPDEINKASNLSPTAPVQTPIGSEQPQHNIPGMVALEAFPSLTSSLADLQTNPLSLGSSLKEIENTPFKDTDQAATAFGTALRSFVDGLKTHSSASQNISNALSAVTSGAGFALSPITSFFDAASKIPIIGSLTKLAVNIPFSAIGDVTGDMGMGVLHALPISDQAKQNLEPGVRAIYTLAGQFGVGAHIAPDVLGTLRDQFGQKDATTIIEKARELAQEKTQTNTGNTGPATTQPAPQTEAPNTEAAPEVKTQATQATPTAPATEVPKTTETPPTESGTQAAGPEKTIEPQTVKVSRAQLPVGTGDTKTSGLEARMKASLDNLSESDRSNLSNYNEMNNKEQLKAAADYVSKNPDEALEVLKGNKPAPKGLLTNSIYLALQEQGKGDIDLATKLASLHSTRAGQEIQILRNADPFSPDNYIREIQESKIESLGRERVKTMMDKEVQSNQPRLQRSLNESRAYTKMTLDDFINHIVC